MATISRLPKNIALFCKRALQKRRIFVAFVMSFLGVSFIECHFWYEVAPIGRLPKNIALFCKRALQNRPIFVAFVMSFLGVSFIECHFWYEVAPIGRLPKNIALFCKRSLRKRPIFCKRGVYMYNTYIPLQCTRGASTACYICIIHIYPSFAECRSLS